MKNLFRFIVITTVSCLAAHSFALAPLKTNPFGIDTIYVFGDSLSDEGVENNNSSVVSPKEPTWTITGGAVWPTALATLLKVTPPTANNTDFSSGQTNIGTVLTGTDYAAGGATTGALGYGAEAGVYSPPPLVNYTQGGSVLYQGQIESYVASHPVADPNGLYIVWAGANDLFVTINTLVTDIREGHVPTQQQIANDISTTITTIITNEVSAVTQLHNIGANNIMVVDVPDLAATPQFQSFIQMLAGYPVYQAELEHALELASYGVLSEMNVAFGAKTLGFNVKAVDVYAPINTIVTTVAVNHGTYTYTFNGASYTITNASDTACPDGSTDGGAIVCAGFDPQTYQNNYLFADGVHPTTQGHQIIANAIYARLLA